MSFRDIKNQIRMEDVLGMYFWDLQDRIMPQELKTPERYEHAKSRQLEILKTGRISIDDQQFEMIIRRLDGAICCKSAD